MTEPSAIRALRQPVNAVPERSFHPSSGDLERKAKHQWLAQMRMAWESQLRLQQRHSLDERPQHTPEEERALLSDVLQGWCHLSTCTHAADGSQVGSFGSCGGTEEYGAEDDCTGGTCVVVVDGGGGEDEGGGGTGGGDGCGGDEGGGEGGGEGGDEGDEGELATEAHVARQLKKQWLLERRREWSEGLAANQQLALDPKEGVVLDGWLTRAYVSSGEAASDQLLAASLQREWLQMKRDAWAQAQRRRRRVADAASGGSGEAPLMPLPSEAKLAAAYTLEWLRQRRKESQIARERRSRARAAEQLQEFAQEFEPARIAPSPRWEEGGEAVQQGEAAQAAQAAQAGRAAQQTGRVKAGRVEVGAVDAGLLSDQRRKWEEVISHRRRLSLEASARTEPEMYAKYGSRPAAQQQQQ